MVKEIICKTDGMPILVDERTIPCSHAFLGIGAVWPASDDFASTARPPRPSTCTSSSWAEWSALTIGPRRDEHAEVEPPSGHRTRKRLEQGKPKGGRFDHLNLTIRELRNASVLMEPCIGG